MVPAADSPSSKALLLVASEISNTLTIHELTSDAFATWLGSNGYTFTGIDTDTDKDGLTDRMEFFFNQSPNNGGDLGNLPKLVPNGGALELDFIRLTDTGSTTGELMISSDLTTWTPALLGVDYTEAASVVTGDETAFTFVLPGTGPSAPGASVAYVAPNTSPPFAAGASMGGVRILSGGLVGVGRLSGNSLDSFGETQGVASGLFITGWAWNGSQFTGKFNVLPDRAYNSGSFYSNYAARLHEVDFTFVPYSGAGPVAQGQIIPVYNNTTRFTYLDGATTKFTTGLNLTGFSTLFGQTAGTVTAANGPGGAQESLLSFDAEAVHLFEDGSGFVSDEYGTYIARFNATKQITGITQLPESARSHNATGVLNFASTAPAPISGRRANQGLEGLSVTPDGTRLFAVMQSALVHDTNVAAADSNTLNEKMEGMALVPDLSTMQGNDFFLFIANDNDFQSFDVKMVNATGALVSYGDGRPNAGITNDAMFYAHRITIDAAGKKFFRFGIK